ncbi:MAG: polysaccharide biosynthesis/export family protein [Nibricoccus sp.]
MHHSTRILLGIISLVLAGAPTRTLAQTQPGGRNAPSSNTSRPSRPGASANLTPVVPPSPSQSAAALATNPSVSTLDLPATDPGYRLSNGDEVAVIIWGEGDVSTDQRIDAKGIIRIPLVGEETLSGKTVREAEKYLENVFVDKKLLRKPMVTISVRDYAARDVSVLGAVGTPGKYRMPKEAGSIEIVELITSLGGFKLSAKSDEVKVTRVDEAGVESVFTVNVQSMITGKGGRNAPKSFLVYPGDRIYVPERLF